MKDDSFSIDVIKRILSVLSTEGNIKKTALAGKTGLNYSALIRYTKFLNTLRWADFSPDPGSLISITPLGRTFRQLLEGGKGLSNISEQVVEMLSIQDATGESRINHGKGGEHPSPFTKAKGESGHDVKSCMLCGKSVRNKAITKEIDQSKYIFDKRECATLFMKFRRIYGRQFSP